MRKTLSLSEIKQVGKAVPAKAMSVLIDIPPPDFHLAAW